MSYIEYAPAASLQDYIAAYWVREAPSGQDSSGRRVYADGCADIIVNTGSTTAWFNPMARAGDAIPLHPGRMYLGGTMTEYGVVTSSAGCILTGIRFRPGGFYALYGQPMAPAVDSLLEFTDHSLQPLLDNEPLVHSERDLPSRLDTYFIAKKIRTRHNFSGIYKTILLSKGQISVEALSNECHMTRRTMERVFKENVGIPPKEFIRIVRFQEVLRRLRLVDTKRLRVDTKRLRTDMKGQRADMRELQGAPRESLLRIAYELGYHDHAHLTNEFKKYAGILPSELSRFYKTGQAFGEYF
jgi:AraC-like DNA-binding protein